MIILQFLLVVIIGGVLYALFSETHKFQQENKKEKDWIKDRFYTNNPKNNFSKKVNK